MPHAEPTTIPPTARTWDDVDVEAAEIPPTDRAVIARRALGAAAVAGFMFDQLSRGGPPGIGMALWIALFALVTITLLWERRGPLGTAESWLIGASVFFGLVPIWADADVIIAFSIMASAGCMLLAGAASTGALQIATARVRDVFVAGVSAGIHAATGAPILTFGDAHWQFRATSGNRKSLAILRGLLIATPLVLIFAALFSSADAGFRALAESFPTIDLDTLLPHLIISGVAAWPIAGWLRATVVADPPKEPASIGNELRLPTIGRVEMITVLGALDALFLTFVLVRLRYAFGGDALVRRTLGLSYAEYAREGFFQLVWVAILTIPTLLGAHALVRKDDPRTLRDLRRLGGALVVLLGIVIASGLDRMRVYTAAYGLTEDRLFATIVMVWLGAVVTWLAMTVLRAKPERFVLGTLVSGLATLGMVSIAHTDALIVRVNAAREVRTGKAMDALYAARLGAGAVPTLVPVLLRTPATSASDSTAKLSRCRAANVLLDQWGAERPNTDWRGWSVTRMRARQVVSGERRALSRLACPNWNARPAQAEAVGTH